MTAEAELLYMETPSSLLSCDYRLITYVASQLKGNLEYFHIWRRRYDSSAVLYMTFLLVLELYA